MCLSGCILQIRYVLSASVYSLNCTDLLFFLQGEIFEAIRKREIVLPQEHEGQLGFNYAWKELLRRAENAGPLTISNTSMYDKELFVSSWKPIMSAISYGMQ